MGATRRESAPPELLCGDAGLVERLRGDQVMDGLGLCKVDAAGEEGALRELAWLGEARAAEGSTGGLVSSRTGEPCAAISTSVVAGVAVGRKEGGDDRVVDGGVGSVGSRTRVNVAGRVQAGP